MKLLPIIYDPDGPCWVALFCLGPAKWRPISAQLYRAHMPQLYTSFSRSMAHVELLSQIFKDLEEYLTIFLDRATDY